MPDEQNTQRNDKKTHCMAKWIFLILILAVIGFTLTKFYGDKSVVNEAYNTKIKLADHLKSFNDDVIIKGPVECTLVNSNHTKYSSQCYEISIYSIAEKHPMGPWCPKNVDDTDVGIWFTDENSIHDVTGAFFKDTNESGSRWWVWGLMKEYGWDKESSYGWKKEGNSFLDEDNKSIIKRPNNADACLAEIIPNIPGGTYVPYVCQECLPLNDQEWFGPNNSNVNQFVYFNNDGSKKVLYTMRIPVNPVFNEVIDGVPSTTRPIAGIGVALNGILLEGKAPLDIKGGILDLKTVVPFDHCGGHVNPQEGYHYHLAEHCYPIIDQIDSHPGLAGFARDGYPIADYDKNTTGLDTCDGHSDDVRGYHYHLAAAGTNRFIGCYRATPEAGALKRAGPPINQ